MTATTQFFQQALFCLSFLVLGKFSTFANTTPVDNTLSPYFFVQSDRSDIDQLPLQSTTANVNIAGVIADVTVKQVYKNTGKKPLEAIYVFPASTRAAVYAMEMKIGNRTISAEIQEKEQAQRAYTQAKAEGKRASLLEQERPNVFQMSVANIQPGDEIKVTLKYTELLVPESGVYEFVYPTVVGPRYTGDGNSQSQFASNPYQKTSEPPHINFDIQVRLEGGMPIQNITCATHKTELKYEGTKTAQLYLDPSESKGGNRDFVMRYQLAGGKIESGLLLYEHEDENFFLLMVQPPKQVKTAQIPPREYVFVVDVSGSMRGFPLDVSKKLLRNLIINLRPTDRFNVLLFAGTSGWLAEESIAATPENIEKAMHVLDNQRGGGSTRLLPALQKSLALPRCEFNLSRSIVVVTDGYVSVEPETFDLIRNHLNEANLFSFGIGSSVNRHLIDGMAHVGMGEPLLILSPENADAEAEKFRQYINRPVLTQIKVDFGDFITYDVEPSSVPDVMAERPVLIFGKWSGHPKGKIKVSGQSGDAVFTQTFDVPTAIPSSKNAALRYLWARERIRLLGDYNNLFPDQDRINEVTNLGLAYNLMTAYTSFLAIDNEVVENEEDIVSVKQALPMPQGVPNSAVGFDLSIEGVIRKSKPEISKTILKLEQIIVKNKDACLQEELENWVQAAWKAVHLNSTSSKLLIEEKVTVSLSLAPSGKVIAVKIFGKKLSEEARTQLGAILKKWQFDGAILEGNTTLEFSILV